MPVNHPTESEPQPGRRRSPGRPRLITRPVRYHEDASGLFQLLAGASGSADAPEPSGVSEPADAPEYLDSARSLDGAARARDTCDVALLESADINTRSGLNSIIAVDSSMRLTCCGQEVTAEALSPTGEFLLGSLATRLAELPGSDAPTTQGNGAAITFRFDTARAADERARLVATSTIEPLRTLLAEEVAGATTELPFIVGGIAFDYVETFESLPPVAESENIFPDYQFLVAEVLLEINHVNRTATLSALAWGEDEERRLAKRLELLAVDIDRADPPALVTPPASGDALQVTTPTPDAKFRRIVEEMKEAIYSGEIYQVVPARSFIAQCPDAYAAYRQLRAINPSPYMFYLRSRIGNRAYELFGSSPESNLKFDPVTRELQLYPIAGTRRRGLNPDGTVNHELDIRNELEMRTDSKELSEHIMLIDLARNDLARVAVPATRRVAELLQVDRYSRVMHLVSRVTATLDEGLDALDAYRACMNMGTLTGAPKLRATELLRGVEKRRRGSYGGAVGYLRAGGAMDTCIVIRSAFVVDGRAIVQAGAGIVRDSQPQNEADETLNKAYAVLNAIALAQGKDVEVLR